MLIYPPSYAWGYDFCFHTIPRCLMSPTKHALYMHTHCWPGRLKSKSNSKPHRLLMRNFHISIIVLVFLKDVGEWFISRSQSVYTRTHIIKYHIWHVPHTHHIYAKTIDTLTKCFSHFLFGVAKEHSEEEMHDWVRATESISGRKPLKPFLLFVAEPRFSSPLSFLFHDIVCFWSSKLSNKIPLLLTATHRVCFH